MEEEQTVFHVTDEEDDIAFKFEQYNLVSAAVVDADKRLVGMLTVDDVVDVIQEEAEEDILHLGGVGGEETISDTRLADDALAFLLAAAQSLHGNPRLLGDLLVRCDDRARWWRSPCSCRSSPRWAAMPAPRP